MKDEPVTILDRDVLKVLSADTRMDILKMLSDGGRTPSFVAKKLRKSDSTIIEHLKAMEKAGLVKKTNAPGKKWVFYTLTERGVGIVSSKSKRLVVILGVSVLALFGSIGSYMSHATSSSGLRVAGAENDAVFQAAEEATKLASAQDQTMLYVALALVTASGIGFGYYFYRKIREMS